MFSDCAEFERQQLQEEGPHTPQGSVLGLLQVENGGSNITERLADWKINQEAGVMDGACARVAPQINTTHWLAATSR